MAEALARGFTSKGVARADNMCCFDPSESRRQALKTFGVTPCSSSVEVRFVFVHAGICCVLS